MPDLIGYGVVVPLVKNTDGNCFVSRYSVSPVISNIFESLLMSLFQDQLSSDRLQFGFKKIIVATMHYSP